MDDAGLKSVQVSPEATEALVAALRLFGLEPQVNYQWGRFEFGMQLNNTHECNTLKLLMVGDGRVEVQHSRALHQPTHFSLTSTASPPTTSPTHPRQTREASFASSSSRLPAASSVMASADGAHSTSPPLATEDEPTESGPDALLREAQASSSSSSPSSSSSSSSLSSVSSAPNPVLPEVPVDEVMQGNADSEGAESSEDAQRVEDSGSSGNADGSQPTDLQPSQGDAASQPPARISTNRNRRQRTGYAAAGAPPPSSRVLRPRQPNKLQNNSDGDNLQGSTRAPRKRNRSSSDADYGGEDGGPRNTAKKPKVAADGALDATQIAELLIEGYKSREAVGATRPLFAELLSLQDDLFPSPDVSVRVEQVERESAAAHTAASEAPAAAVPPSTSASSSSPASSSSVAGDLLERALACGQKSQILSTTGRATSMLGHWSLAAVLHLYDKWNAAMRKRRTAASLAPDHSEDAPWKKVLQLPGLTRPHEQAALRSLWKLVRDDARYVGCVELAGFPGLRDVHASFFADLSWVQWKALLAASAQPLRDDVMTKLAEHMYKGQDWMERGWVEKADWMKQADRVRPESDVAMPPRVNGPTPQGIRTRMYIPHVKGGDPKVITKLGCDHISARESCPGSDADREAGNIIELEGHEYNTRVCHSWLVYANHLPNVIANCQLLANGLLVQRRTMMSGDWVTWDYGPGYWPQQLSGLDYNRWKEAMQSNEEWGIVFDAMHREVEDYGTLLGPTTPRVDPHNSDMPLEKQMQAFVDHIAKHVNKLRDKRHKEAVKKAQDEAQKREDVAQRCMDRVNDAFYLAMKCMDEEGDRGDYWNANAHHLYFLYAVAVAAKRPEPTPQADDYKVVSYMIAEYTRRIPDTRDAYTRYVKQQLLGESLSPVPSPSPSTSADAEKGSGEYWPELAEFENLSCSKKDDDLKEAADMLCEKWAELALQSREALRPLHGTVEAELKRLLSDPTQADQLVEIEADGQLSSVSSRALYLVTHHFYVATDYFTFPLPFSLHTQGVNCLIRVYEMLLAKQDSLSEPSKLITPKAALRLELILEVALCLTQVYDQQTIQVERLLDELSQDLVASRWKPKKLGFLVLPDKGKSTQDITKLDDHELFTMAHVNQIAAHFLRVWSATKRPSSSSPPAHLSVHEDGSASEDESKEDDEEVVEGGGGKGERALSEDDGDEIDE